MTLCVVMLVSSLLLLAPFGPAPVFSSRWRSERVVFSSSFRDKKGVPLASYRLYIATAFVHFLMGYSVFRELDGRSLGIASFFALMFAAGHLTHEARDCASGTSLRTESTPMP